MANVGNLVATIEPKPWFGVALSALAVTCAVASWILPKRLVGWLADIGVSALARHGIRIAVHVEQGS